MAILGWHYRAEQAVKAPKILSSFLAHYTSRRELDRLSFSTLALCLRVYKCLGVAKKKKEVWMHSRGSALELFVVAFFHGLFCEVYWSGCVRGYMFCCSTSRSFGNSAVGFFFLLVVCMYGKSCLQLVDVLVSMVALYCTTLHVH